jgi:hypothetical protein
MRAQPTLRRPRSTTSIRWLEEFPGSEREMSDFRGGHDKDVGSLVLSLVCWAVFFVGLVLSGVGAFWMASCLLISIAGFWCVYHYLS